MTSLLSTLVELGHATSQNLGFAQTVGPGFSFGEETITETNLLEIRRRHPDKVIIQSFSKMQESKATGADWEWHIIGKFRTLKLRVQAKRIYKAGGIGNLNQMGKWASKPQIDLLLDDAKKNRLVPIYCFYCSEDQRTFWKTQKLGGKTTSMETGCLIADAYEIKKIGPKKFKQIEEKCIPWHYLCFRCKVTHKKNPYLVRFDTTNTKERYIDEFELFEQISDSGLFIPTIADLNSQEYFVGMPKSIAKRKTDPIKELPEAKFVERGISKLIQIDVRSPEHFEGR